MKTDFAGWVAFYSEFADKLLVFKDRRGELVSIIKDVYSQIGMKLPTLNDGDLVDIDPFSVYGLFNKGISHTSRVKIAGAFKDRLGMIAPVPDYFGGIPVLNNLHATFYGFGADRGSDDIENIWVLFERALAMADSSTPQGKEDFVDAYDQVRPQYGIKWNLTMALYWIRPLRFINLDSRNRWYIADRGGLDDQCAHVVRDMKDSVPDGMSYLRFCSEAKRVLERGNHGYGDFPGLSAAAWEISEQVNEEKKAAAKEPTGSTTLGDDGVSETRYWLISPGHNAFKWDEFRERGIISVGWGELGDLSRYDSKDGIRRALKEVYGGEGSKKNDTAALWDFANSIKPGDIVYAKKGQSIVLGRGIVKGPYEFDGGADEYPNMRCVEWTNTGSWPHPGKAVTKTLTDITSYTGYVAKLEALFVDEEGSLPETPQADFPPYGKEDFLSDVYLPEDEYDKLALLVKTKRNVILQGAPGVGKTFMAKRLAYSIMGERNAERVKLVQFHQSYSYEDFIMGYRPSQDGFELKTGAFYDFCKLAEADKDNDYFFIIDEINRGNLSKIFGELFMLVEPDKRGYPLQLLYSDEQFSVPENLCIIGMMNTADRSLAMIDYALRRRFAFYEIAPAFSSKGFRAYQKEFASERFDRLVQQIEQLNDAIERDDSLGRGFRIGHSYLCGMDEARYELLEQVIDFEIVPLLEEYWFDEPGKVRDWKSRLKAAIG